MSTNPVELRDEEEPEEKLSASSDDEEEDGDFPLLLILTTGLWTILFAIFSFGFDTDPDTCIVSNKDDLVGRIAWVDKEDPDNPNTVDVAVRFKFFFDVAFIVSCIQLGIGMVGIFVGHIENKFKTLMVLLFWLCNITLILLWVYVFLVRYEHSG